MTYEKILDKLGVDIATAIGNALDEILHTVEVPIVVGNGLVPTKATKGSGGYDLFLSDDVVAKDGRFLAPLDIKFSLPTGFAAIIKPRSGYTLKGMDVLNSYKQKVRVNAWVNDGVIDSDYTGLVGVLMQMSGKGEYIIPKGTKVAQMLVVRVYDVKWKPVETLDTTERGGGGFGHSDE